MKILHILFLKKKKKILRILNMHKNTFCISTSPPHTSFLSIPNKPTILRLQLLGKYKNFDFHISVDCNQEDLKKKKKKSLNSSKKFFVSVMLNED